MPSREHAADLERVLTRAAEECEAKQAWFGEGLPQALRAAIESHVRAGARGAAEVAFVEVRSLTPQGRATLEGGSPGLSCPVVGLSTAPLDDLRALFQHDDEEAGSQLTRLVCPVAVFDFIPEGLRIREIRHGLTAADLQRHIPVKLWSGPDLKELGRH